MSFKLNRFHSETASPIDQPAPAPPSRRRIGKKTYVTVAALVAVAVIVGALLLPQGAATIPLTVNYDIGEKMVYNQTLTASIDNYESTLSSFESSLGSLQNVTYDATTTIEVIGYDAEGEYYTLNNTVSMELLNQPESYSYLERVNKTGYSSYIFNFNGQETATNFTNNPYITELLSRPEVKVGDSWTIAYPVGIENSSSIQTNGELTMTFVGFEDLTVPAGTFRVFRVDITANFNTQTTLPAFTANSSSSTMTSHGTVSGTMYMEDGTLRQIKSDMQQTLTLQSSYLNYTLPMSMLMELTQYIKP